MLFFDSLFVLIARFFLNIWKNYSNWWVNVRYGITLFYLLNLLTLLAFIGQKMNMIIFMVLFAGGYLFISFYHPILNDKEYIDNFELSILKKNLPNLYGCFFDIVRLHTCFYSYGITTNPTSDFSLYLLENANVATVTGEAFGDPNCIRISYAASEENIVEALKRIKEALG